jgi:hypothetical protein
MEIGNEVKHKKYGYGIITDKVERSERLLPVYHVLFNVEHRCNFLEVDLELINPFRRGQEVEVCYDDNGVWEKAIFVCYDHIIDCSRPFCCKLLGCYTSHWFENCRIPQPKPQVDLSFKVNGKEVDISNLSKETVENILKEIN